MFGALLVEDRHIDGAEGHRSSPCSGSTTIARDRDAMRPWTDWAEHHAIIGDYGASRQRQMLRVAAIDRDLEQYGLASLGAPITARASGRDRRDRLAGGACLKWMVD